MARKRKKQGKKSATRQPAPMRWEFDPGIPTLDFFEGRPLEDPSNLEDAVDSFISWVLDDHFLTWEAVVCDEQGLPLTAAQKKALGNLLNFNDEDEDADEILYIDEIPRPSEPWYVILNKIAPHLLIEPFDTSGMYGEAQLDGWDGIMTALQGHGPALSLPPGVASYREVVPAELRHKLCLQHSYEALHGLGKGAELTLANEQQQDRVDAFIDRLRECKESVAYFGLTLESLLSRVLLPQQDRPIFIRMMQEKLGLGSPQEPLADLL